MDAALIGEQAAKAIDKLVDEEGELIAVGIVVVIDKGESTVTRISSSRETYFERLGLFRAAVDIIESDED